MLIELFLGVNNFEWDNIAHFAHLGGALFGFLALILLKIKRKFFLRR
ncbi:MAG: rhomboid family intramembrane serine protease [Bacteroidota bacterium]